MAFAKIQALRLEGPISGRPAYILAPSFLVLSITGKHFRGDVAWLLGEPSSPSICLLVALYLVEKKECLMVEDLDAGYILVPYGNSLSKELEIRCE